MVSLRLNISASTVLSRGFSPLSLDPVAFYDPSDTSTLFQDAVGTTPVTTAGDPVRLVLDKSQGLALGVELVTNGDFATDLSGWIDRTTGSGSATWTADGVEISRVDGGNTGQITQDVAVTEGEWYTFEVTRVSGSGTAFRLGSTTANNQLYDEVLAAGTTTVTVQATTSLISVGLRGAINDSTMVIGGVSMRYLPGNHLTAPSSAARPIYQTGNGLHWLEFDGVDDELSAAGPLPFSTTLFNCTAFRATSVSNNVFPHVLRQRSAAVSDNSARHPLISLYQNTPQRVGVLFGDSSATVTLAASVVNQDIVASGYCSPSEVQMNANGTTASQSGVTLLDGRTDPFSISGGSRFNGRFYGAVQCNTVPSPSQIAQVRQWFTLKAIAPGVPFLVGGAQFLDANGDIFKVRQE